MFKDASVLPQEIRHSSAQTSTAPLEDARKAYPLINRGLTFLEFVANSKTVQLKGDVQQKVREGRTRVSSIVEQSQIDKTVRIARFGTKEDHCGDNKDNSQCYNYRARPSQSRSLPYDDIHRDHRDDKCDKAKPVETSCVRRPGPALRCAS